MVRECEVTNVRSSQVEYACMHWRHCNSMEDASSAVGAG